MKTDQFSPFHTTSKNNFIFALQIRLLFANRGNRQHLRPNPQPQECIRESSNQEEPVTTTSVAFIARWVARAWSILNILIVFLFAIGESLRPVGAGPNYQEWIGLALWPVGVAIGLLVAWLHEVAGGTVALASLAAFYLWNLFRSGHLPRGPFFLLIAAPAVVFLLAASLSPRKNK